MSLIKNNVSLLLQFEAQQHAVELLYQLADGRGLGTELGGDTRDGLHYGQQLVGIEHKAHVTAHGNDIGHRLHTQTTAFDGDGLGLWVELVSTLYSLALDGVGTGLVFVEGVSDGVETGFLVDAGEFLFNFATGSSTAHLLQQVVALELAIGTYIGPGTDDGGLSSGLVAYYGIDNS